MGIPRPDMYGGSKNGSTLRVSRHSSSQPFHVNMFAMMRWRDLSGWTGGKRTIYRRISDRSDGGRRSAGMLEPELLGAGLEGDGLEVEQRGQDLRALGRGEGPGGRPHRHPEGRALAENDRALDLVPQFPSESPR